jgi:large subunit ribosomal protein L31
MKADIHPKFYEKSVATCGCGKVYTLGMTIEKMAVDICANCHPFYTGKEKLIDTAGKVEKFKQRRAAVEKAPKKEKKVRVAKNKKPVA